jgi:hypothetical protein
MSFANCQNNRNCFLNQQIFLIETLRVSFEVGVEFLNYFLENVRLQRFNCIFI